MMRTHLRLITKRPRVVNLIDEKPTYRADPIPPELEALRPKKRSDCANVPRPCPFVSCSMNLYLDVVNGGHSIKLNFPDLEPDELRESCALDVADRGEHTLEEIGTMMCMVRERIRQIEDAAHRKLSHNASLRAAVKEDLWGG